MSAPITHASLHHAIARHFVDRGSAPSVAALSEHLSQPPGVVREALRALEEYHGVVLHPASGEIWAMHPFSAAPTAFWVETSRGGWWGNCAWCSLGVAALVGDDATITTTIGGESERVVIRIVGGVVQPSHLLVHFPIPMARAWDNVTYTCSTMLVFDSVPDVDAWCARHAIPRGDVRPIGTIWAFAQEWYGRHLDADWSKWTTDEARELFARFGLSGPIWDLPETRERF